MHITVMSHYNCNEILNFMSMLVILTCNIGINGRKWILCSPFLYKSKINDTRTQLISLLPSDILCSDVITIIDLSSNQPEVFSLKWNSGQKNDSR